VPALPAISGVVKVLLQYALPGVVDVLTRLFFQGTGSTTNSALNTWAGNVAAAWNTNMAPVVIPALVLNAITAEDLTTSTSPIGAWSGSHAGTFSPTSDLSPGVAMIVKNLTPLRQRGGHSRTYLPGMPVNYLSSSGANTWASGSATTVLTAWKAFLSAITGSSGPTGYSGLAQVVPNYYHGFTAVENPLTGRYRNVPKVVTTPTTQLVTSQVVNLTLGSQRRRNHQSA